jgi:hypothetical protein
MSTPVFDSVLSQVLGGAQVARDRLANARAGIDRLHGPDAHERCPTCREAWPCATRRLVDGLSRGDLDRESSQELVDEALRKELVDAGEDEPAAPSRIPSMAELFEGTRTGKALDVLFGHKD